MGKVERLGMGVKKMRSAMAAAGLRPPEFETNGFFRAVFYRSPELAMKDSDVAREKGWKKVDQRLVEKVGRRLVEGLAETQRKILNLMGENPRIAKRELASKIGISTTAIDKNIASLKSRGLVWRVGPDKGGHWEVVTTVRRKIH
jgi:ATP-dependent DNA helicase RecG